MRSHRQSVDYGVASSVRSGIYGVSSHRGSSTPSSLRDPDKARERRKTKLILVLGIALPVFACIIGVAAWAITTDVLRISPRENNFGRYGHRSKNRLTDNLKSRSDEGVDIFQFPALKGSTVPLSPSTTRARLTTTRRPSIRTSTTAIASSFSNLPDSHRPSDVLSKLIAKTPGGMNSPKSFVVFAPVASDDVAKAVAKMSKNIVVGHRPATTTIQTTMTSVDDDMMAEESVEEGRVKIPPLSVSRKRKASEERDGLDEESDLVKEYQVAKGKTDPDLEFLQVDVGSILPPLLKKRMRHRFKPESQTLSNRNGADVQTPTTTLLESLPSALPLVEEHESESNAIQQHPENHKTHFSILPRTRQIVEIGKSPKSYEKTTISGTVRPQILPKNIVVQNYQQSNPSHEESQIYQGHNVQSQPAHYPQALAAHNQQTQSGQYQQPPPTNYQQLPPTNYQQSPQTNYQQSPPINYQQQQPSQYQQNHHQESKPQAQQPYYQSHNDPPSVMSQDFNHQGQFPSPKQPSQYSGQPPPFGNQYPHGASYSSDNFGSGPQYFAPPPQTFHTKASYEPKYPPMTSYEKIAQSSFDSNVDGSGMHHHHHHHHHHPENGGPERDVNLSDVPHRNDADRLGTIGVGLGSPRGITLQIGGGGGGGGGGGIGLGSLLPFSALGIARNLVSALLPKPLSSKVFLGVEVGRGNSVFSIG